VRVERERAAKVRAGRRRAAEAALERAEAAPNPDAADAKCYLYA
jgi:hypothetical protein